MRGASNRGVSTVVDITLALLLISASVLLIGFHLDSSDEPVPDDRADQVLQSLSATTSSVLYDITEENGAGVSTLESENFEPPGDLDSAERESVYEVTTYGSSIGLLADAALANLRIDGSQRFTYGDAYEDAVDHSIRGTHVGGEHHFYAVATWAPYDGSSLNGTATAGRQPPSTGDVSSASTTVTSGVPELGPEELAREFEREETSDVGTPFIDDADTDGFDAVATVVAESIVEGYFPFENTQYSLESSLTERSVTVYNYKQLADSVDVTVDDHISGTSPDTATANETLVGDIDADNGLGDWIATDMRNGPVGEQIIHTWNDSTADNVVERLEETFEEVTSPETIDVTVQAWDP
ncbi:DUF7284 family protein [Halostagnicola bangensis]